MDLRLVQIVIKQLILSQRTVNNRILLTVDVRNVERVIRLMIKDIAKLQTQGVMEVNLKETLETPMLVQTFLCQIIVQNKIQVDADVQNVIPIINLMIGDIVKLKKMFFNRHKFLQVQYLSLLKICSKKIEI